MLLFQEIHLMKLGIQIVKSIQIQEYFSRCKMRPENLYMVPQLWQVQKILPAFSGEISFT